MAVIRGMATWGCKQCSVQHVTFTLGTLPCPRPHCGCIRCPTHPMVLVAFAAEPVFDCGDYQLWIKTTELA